VEKDHISCPGFLVRGGDAGCKGRKSDCRGRAAPAPAPARGHARGPRPADPLSLRRLLRGQAAAARARRVRKLMEPPGPPERTLTRQAMEQMRFLGREWPVHRLARGFQVQPEVVLRVLRSRFSPSPERRRKQDARALASSRPRPGADEAAPRLQPASPAGSPARGPGSHGTPGHVLFHSCLGRPLGFCTMLPVWNWLSSIAWQVEGVMLWVTDGLNSGPFHSTTLSSGFKLLRNGALGLVNESRFKTEVGNECGTAVTVQTICGSLLHTDSLGVCRGTTSSFAPWTS
uniref:Neurite outgrowth-associated protein n=1 Tax=Varanus komodoensis TaxID=61221 RepID=A0A8D2LN85_VARKO